MSNKSMKSWFLVGNEKMELRNVSRPVPKDDEVLIKNKAIGICNRTDLVAYMYNNDPTERFGYELPQTDDFGYKWVIRSPLYLDHFGHEITGIVEKAGKDIKNVTVGDRVFLRGPVRSYDYSGFAEYSLAKEYKIGLLPEHLSFEEGVLGELIPIAIGAAKSIKVGDYVGILGQGPGGLMVTQLTRLMGASKIIVADKHRKRLSLAKKVGADYVIDITKENIEKKTKEILKVNDLERNGLDVVIDAVGTPSVLRECFRLVKPGGVVAIFGTHHLEPVIIDLVKWEEKGVTVHMANETCEEEFKERIERARRLFEGKMIKTKPMISHIFPLEELPKAFEMLKNDPHKVVKIVIKP